MALFALGDTHLSFSADKPMDVFRGWDNYTDRLESNWNSIVGADDTVVIPGDISWGTDFPSALEDFRFLNALNGKKIILKGNHDYWWNTMKKMQAFISDNGFSTISILHNNAYRYGDFALAGTRGWFFDDASPDDRKVIAREAGRLQMSIAAAKELGGEIIVFLHYPPVLSGRSCDEILSVLIENNIKRCFFGHLHGFIAPENASFFESGIEFRLVSADYLEFCPKLIV